VKTEKQKLAAKESDDKGKSIELSVNAADLAGSNAEADSEEQTEMSSENKIEQQIIEQAKMFADQQRKQQQEQMAKGGVKISSAAQALNNAEMGVSSAESE
jgi:predicted HNH restriction endonuclease